MIERKPGRYYLARRDELIAGPFVVEADAVAARTVLPGRQARALRVVYEPTQIEQIRTVIAEMEMLSYGGTQNFASSGGGESESVGPAGAVVDGRPDPDRFLHDRYARLLAQEGPSEQLLEDAKAALNAERKRDAAAAPKVSEETRDQRNQRIIKEGKGFDPKTVAQSSIKCSEKEVIAARLGAGLDPQTGESTSHGNWPEVDELVAQALSYRSIAMKLGVDRGRVQRYLTARSKAA